MRAAAFANRRSVELDAIDPNRLRKLVEDAINRRMSKKLYAKLMKAEQDEQDEIRELVDQISWRRGVRPKLLPNFSWLVAFATDPGSAARMGVAGRTNNSRACARYQIGE